MVYTMVYTIVATRLKLHDSWVERRRIEIDFKVGDVTY
jgi:hypothetical protein